MEVERLALDALLGRARDEPKQTRIRFRGPIAAHGAEAVKAISGWLAEKDLGAFAVHVLAYRLPAGGRMTATDRHEHRRPVAALSLCAPA